MFLMVEGFSKAIYLARLGKALLEIILCLEH
jgi:hypothetical protein